jgi:hypothetical protein
VCDVIVNEQKTQQPHGILLEDTAPKHDSHTCCINHTIISPVIARFKHGTKVVVIEANMHGRWLMIGVVVAGTTMRMGRDGGG